MNMFKLVHKIRLSQFSLKLIAMETNFHIEKKPRMPFSNQNQLKYLFEFRYDTIIFRFGNVYKNRINYFQYSKLLYIYIIHYRR